VVESPLGLSNSALKRLDKIDENAEREFNQTMMAVNRANTREFWKGEEIRVPAIKEAALKYLGTVLFFLLDRFRSMRLFDDELRSRVNAALIGLRQVTLEHKWPESLYLIPNRHEREQQFDAALIQWLDNREEWRKYEAQVLPHIAVGPEPRAPDQEALSPILYFELWPLENLPKAARTRIKAKLSEMHGAFLDNKLSDEVDCWRRTYDLMAEELNSADLLSEDLLKRIIPGITADAAAGAGWSREPFGRVRPTGVFSERFGSQFYPIWRLSAFFEALKGRTTHWMGQSLGESTARPHDGKGPKKALSAVVVHRRQILKNEIAKKNLERMDGLARYIGTTASALYGMTREDRTRYSERSLKKVLEKICCSRAEWDEIPNTSSLL
jgi:hypothetical protein